MALPATGVFWKGADGNYYVNSAGLPGGVHNLGSSGNFAPLSQSIIDGLQQINDPNVKAPTDPNNTAGSGSSTVDKSYDIQQQNGFLDNEDTKTAAGLKSVDDAIARLNGQYDTETAANTKAYTTSTDQNKVNFTKNKEIALVNAAEGRQGLNGVLGSLGALNGSGIVLADRAVAKGANDDLNGADDNYSTNQQGLDAAVGAYNAADKLRRQQASDQGVLVKQGVENDAATERLGAYQNLVKDYADSGDSANAKKYSDLATALFPTLAKTSVPTSLPTAQTAAFTLPSLASYLSGKGGTTVAVAPSTPGGIPGLIASPTKRKVLQPA